MTGDMDIAIDERWESFVKDAVDDGRFGSADEVVQAGLRLLQQQEAKLQSLRETLAASIERGGLNSGAEVLANVQSSLDEWERGKAAA